MNIKNVLRFVTLILLLSLVTTMFAGCRPKQEAVVVQKVSWAYNIEIEKETLCQESGWALPSGATLVEQKRERYKKKQDSDGNFTGWEYRTKYYYEIMRWKYERDVKTSGEDQNPYYGEPNLADNERISSKTQKHYIHVLNGEGETAVYPIGYDEWSKIGPGDTLELKISFWGLVVEILSHEKAIEKFN